MKSCTAKKLIAILKAHGFSLVRQKGSHMICKNTERKIPLIYNSKNNSTDSLQTSQDLRTPLFANLVEGRTKRAILLSSLFGFRLCSQGFRNPNKELLLLILFFGWNHFPPAELHLREKLPEATI